MQDLFGSFNTNYNNISRLALFNIFKTGDPIYDAIISTFVISIIGYITNFVYDYFIRNIFFKLSVDDIQSLFLRKNTIIIEGKRNCVTSNYSCTTNISSIYSDRFKAIWNYIISNMDKNHSIYKIKEAHSNFQSSEDGEGKRKNMDIFMVYQSRYFKLDEFIYANAEIEQEDEHDDKDKVKTKTDKITISIYSYIYNVSYLKNYIDNITNQYLSSIKDNRINKRFIYFLDKVDTKEEGMLMDYWREDLFESARTFNNIFFDGKKDLISKIDFFINNRDWYYEKGIPYSLGIGLHGPPGTGKTSFIKALANYTGRHIIVISLKMIKTKSQLEKFFFENTYNDNNECNSISFNKKIIVFEDIDCIGDIVLDRSKTKFTNKKNSHKNSHKNSDIQINKRSTNDNNIKMSDVIQSICQINESGNNSLVSNILSQDQPITLDDILNLWDGIRETPGRILIISSNHYNKLDSALTRPGRIDITHELCNASHNTIKEIYYHLFGNQINKTKLNKIKEYFYSPAELINIYVTYKTETGFLDRLLKNKKV